MLRLLLGSNGVVLRSVVTKYIRNLMKKVGLNAKFDTKDFVVYDEGDELLVHISGDMRIKKSELLNFLNKTLDVAE